MKRKITLIIIILFTVATKAQSYFPLRNVETNLESFSGVNGQWISVNPASSTLGAYYYQGLNFGFDTNNYASLVNGVGTNELYFGRWSGGWKGWNKIWHSGNLNNTDTDFTAKTINITGKLGIGTTNPQAGLDIKNSYNINATKALKMFYEGSWGTAQYASDYRFIDIQSTEEGKILALNAYGMGIGFNPPSYSSQDKLYINGNVGIGTNSPTAKLETLNTTAGVTSFKTVGVNGYLLVDNVGSGENYYNAKKFHEFQIDGVSKMTINLNGNVGIGTSTPTGSLELVKLNSNLVFDLNTNGISKIISKGWNASIDIHTFQINGTENFNQLNLNSNGNVGIGTTNPTSKLTVAGNINSREVKVTVDAGADFVFENGYNLPSLESVDKFIKQNKHLPEIASASEMQKDGINLSEMNIKLLQKIEELTLYSIDQNKKIEAQAKEIESLKDLVLRVTKIESELARK